MPPLLQTWAHLEQAIASTAKPPCLPNPKTAQRDCAGSAPRLLDPVV